MRKVLTSAHRHWRLRSATALAAAGALVMTSGVLLAAASTATAGQTNTSGNDGTVKIADSEPDISETPENNPFVDCSFAVEWFNYAIPFNDTDVDTTVSFELQEPTAGAGYSVSPTSDTFGFTPTNGYYRKSYTLTFGGAPQKAPNDKHGYHVKVTVDTEYSQGASVKHKVFWVGPCQPVQPAQPDPVTVSLTDQQMSCDFGVEGRSGTLTTTYVWNASTRQYDAVTAPASWGAWTFIRDLTDAEFESLDCRPDQPQPTVIELTDQRMDCDINVERRQGTQTTSYVWNAETRAYDQVVGPEVWGDWAKTRNLTAEEALALDCIAGEETVIPKPDKPEPKPDKKPTVKGVEVVAPPVAAPTAVAAGLGGDTGSSTGQLFGKGLAGLGLVMLLAAGWLNVPRNVRGVHES